MLGLHEPGGAAGAGQDLGDLPGHPVRGPGAAVAQRVDRDVVSPGHIEAVRAAGLTG
ncbi:hypothetical protein ACSLFT_26210 [Streptomyces sp. G6]|uniref:hypothetical protein n=1 Tax=Streptomyces sp. G6 TaxID=1178736 RepID=UPI003EDAC2AC